MRNRETALLTTQLQLAGELSQVVGCCSAGHDEELPVGLDQSDPVVAGLEQPESEVEGEDGVGM